jgi:predicted secreted protein
MLRKLASFGLRARRQRFAIHFAALYEHVMHAYVGDVFEISLEGSPTTGFRWELLTNLGTRTIQLLDEEWKAETKLVGAPVAQRFRFRALAPGEFNLVFAYRRSWEKEPREQRSFLVKIEERPKES